MAALKARFGNRMRSVGSDGSSSYAAKAAPGGYARQAKQRAAHHQQARQQQQPPPPRQQAPSYRGAEEDEDSWLDYDVEPDPSPPPPFEAPISPKEWCERQRAGLSREADEGYDGRRSSADEGYARQYQREQQEQQEEEVVVEVEGYARRSRSAQDDDGSPDALDASVGRGGHPKNRPVSGDGAKAPLRRRASSGDDGVRRRLRRELPKPYAGPKEAHEAKEAYNGALRGADANEKLIKQPVDQLFFSKKARPVNFEPYTLESYRQTKPEKYQELGKLQPDLNRPDLVAKRSNAERVKEFSRNLRVVNGRELQRHPPTQPTAAAAAAAAASEINKPAREPSKRDKAAAFARNIPKPRVAVVWEKNNPNLKPHPPAEEGDGQGAPDYGHDHALPTRLEQLEARHDQYRSMADDIRRQYGF